jgi:hypothetical protein
VACPLLSQSDGGDLGVGEHDARDGAVVGRPGSASDVVHDDARLVHADVGERHDAGHIPDRPDPVASLAALVDGHTVCGDPDAQCVEAVDPRPAARRHEQLVCRHGAVVGEPNDASATLPLDLDGPRAESHVDPLLPEPFADQLADGGILACQEPVRPLHDRHLGAEAAQELAELDPDRPAAEDHHVLRDLVQVGRLAVRPIAGLRKAWYLRHGRVAAGGNDDPLALEPGPVHLHAARRRKARLGLVDADPVALLVANSRAPASPT